MHEKEISAELYKKEISILIYNLVQEILIGERELAVLLKRENVMADREVYLKLGQNARIIRQADLQAFEIQHLNLKTDIMQTRLKINAGRRSLLALVKIPDKQLVLNPVSDDWNNVLALLDDEEALITNAFSRSAELAAAQAAYEKACFILDTAKTKQIPWFDSVQFSYTPDFEDGLEPQWKVSLRVNLPVFIWLSSEKKMAIAEIEAAQLQKNKIREQIRNDITAAIGNLCDALHLLKEYQAALDSIPEPAREKTLDLETYFKLMDTWLSASEYALKTEMQCALIYSQLLEAMQFE